MTVTMVSLLVQDGLVLTSTADGHTAETFRSEPALQAHLVLDRQDDADLAQLGIVHLRIAATPRSLPAMTPQATVLWLRSALTRLLAADDPPSA